MVAVPYQRFSDRFFRLSPLYTYPGWYFKARDGCPIGPFLSREGAERAAQKYAEDEKRSGRNGGRTSGPPRIFH